MESMHAPGYLMNLHYIHIVITCTCIALLTLFYEALLFRTEIKVSWPKALGYAVISLVLFGLTQIIIFVIAVIAFLVYFLYNPQAIATPVP